MVATELFGGAMQFGLPEGFADAADFRQVPDNQEVFTSADTGCCVIVELLSLERGVTNEGCGEFFFGDIAKVNSSLESRVTSPQATLDAGAAPIVTQVPPGGTAPYACTIGGTQVVSKFHETGRENLVYVAVGAIRYSPPIATDIVISVTAPLQISSGSSEQKVVSRVLTDVEVQQVCVSALASVRVNSFGLFVPEE